MTTDAQTVLMKAIETLEKERADTPKTNAARTSRNERRLEALEEVVMVLLRMQLDGR